MNLISEEVIGAIENRISEHTVTDVKTYLVAIDGRCAAGKTTLAENLRQKYPCNVIHMDDFYLRPEQRTPERYSEPGGNIDYERFLAEVLIPLKGGRTFSYHPYDCKTQTVGAPITVEPKPLTIVEGSYSCHPKFRGYYDMHIFLDVDADEQLRRIRNRNGEEALYMFKEKWIPLEEAYIKAASVEEFCELHIGANAYIE